MQGPYAEHILDANDVCANCHRQNRVERVDPVMATDGLRHELDSHYSRRRELTTVEYHDGGREPTKAKGVFCECGVEGAHERIWSPETVTREPFKELLQNAIKTLLGKGVNIRPKETARYALAHYDAEGDADKALSYAVEMGQVAAIAAPTNKEVAVDD